MNISDINMSDFTNEELLVAQSSVEKFLKGLNTEYADAKKKEEENS